MTDILTQLRADLRAHDLLSLFWAKVRLANAEAVGIHAAGFPLDPVAERWAASATVSADTGDWISCAVALGIAAAIEPAVWTDAYQTLMGTIAGIGSLVAGGESARGMTAEAAANGNVCPGVPSPVRYEPRRWASKHGSAVVLRDGKCRIVMPLGSTPNYTVTLPLVGVSP